MAEVTITPRIRCDNCGFVQDKEGAGKEYRKPRRIDEAIADLNNGRYVAMEGYGDYDLPGAAASIIEDLRHERDTLAARLEEAKAVLDASHTELSCLLANPDDFSVDKWPVENPADAACLAAAYGPMRAFLHQGGEDAR